MHTFSLDRLALRLRRRLRRDSNRIDLPTAACPPSGSLADAAKHTLSLSTDKADYAPGETVQINTSGLIPGEKVTFTISDDPSDPGDDGDVDVYPRFSIRDGTARDLDGERDGRITTTWRVPSDDDGSGSPPPDALNGTLILRARSSRSERRGSTSFTDSGGAYSLKWLAADPAANKPPALATYRKLSPAAYQQAGYAFPVGAADLPANNPLDPAVAYAPPANPSDLDAVSSLAPKDMALGQIVPFFLEITANGNTNPEGGVISFTSEWLTKTTSGGDFGFDPTAGNGGIVAAFIDSGEAGGVDSGGSPNGTARVVDYSATLADPGGNNEAIRGTFKVAGLDSGDKVFVEIWVALKKTIASGVSGNVQTALLSAQTVPATGSGEKINGGNQTIPLLRVQEFFSANADLSVIKSDSVDAATNPLQLTAQPDIDPANLIPGDVFTYTIKATNHSSDTVANGVVVTDTLDPYLVFVEASDGGVYNTNGAAADTVNWSLGALEPGASRTLSVKVLIDGLLPPDGGFLTLVNNASITAITADPDPSDNSNSEPTLFDPPSLAIDKQFLNVNGDAKQQADSVGDVLNYSITLTNAGEGPLTAVSLVDPLTGQNLSGERLAAGESRTYTSSYILTQADLDGKGGGDSSLENTATADAAEVAPISDTATVPLIYAPGMTLEKTLVSVNGNAGEAANSAGDVLNYSFKLSNSGNITLTGLSLSDPLLNKTFTSLSLAPGESTTFNGNYILSQADLDTRGGGDDAINNTATADAAEVDPISDSVAVPLVYRPALKMDKVTSYEGRQGDGLTNVIAGRPISWIYTVSNSGTVALPAVTVSDSVAGVTPRLDTAASSGDEDGTLNLGDVWVYTAQGTAVAGNYSNIGNASASFAGIAVTASDGSSYSGKDAALIAPTGTTPEQYISGNAQTFQQYYASQGGVIQYNVKTSGPAAGRNSIVSANPGVFFYYSGLSGALIGSDGNDADSAADPITVRIDQSDTSDSFPALQATKNDVKLYKVSDTNRSGVIDSGDTVSQVQLSNGSITLGSNGDAGDVSITFTPDQVGSQYVLSVKYSTGALAGVPVGSDASKWPKVNYRFTTNVGANDTIEETDTGGIDAAPKFTTSRSSNLTLQGPAGDGAAPLCQDELQPLIREAIAAWAAHGADDASLDQLTGTPVRIAELGGRRLASWDGKRIWIDDDAAGHGWSLHPEAPAATQVDLLSALVHEFGHRLGHSHDQLTPRLGIGERDLTPLALADAMPGPLPPMPMPSCWPAPFRPECAGGPSWGATGISIQTSAPW